MKHKWKKSDFKKLIITDIIGTVHTCVKIYECINCDLRKGIPYSSNHPYQPCDLRKGIPYSSNYQPWLIYFKDSKILSFNRIPYECSGINFLKEDDFYIT